MQTVPAGIIPRRKTLDRLNAWKYGNIARHAESTRYTGRRSEFFCTWHASEWYGGTQMKIFKFFRNVSREMAKVSWPKGRELFNYTVTVIGTVLFFAIFFGIVDFGISEFLNAFFE